MSYGDFEKTSVSERVSVGVSPVSAFSTSSDLFEHDRFRINRLKCIIYVVFSDTLPVVDRVSDSQCPYALPKGNALFGWHNSTYPPLLRYRNIWTMEREALSRQGEAERVSTRVSVLGSTASQAGPEYILAEVPPHPPTPYPWIRFRFSPCMLPSAPSPSDKILERTP